MCFLEFVLTIKFKVLLITKFKGVASPRAGGLKNFSWGDQIFECGLKKVQLQTTCHKHLLLRFWGGKVLYKQMTALDTYQSTIPKIESIIFPVIR